MFAFLQKREKPTPADGLARAEALAGEGRFREAVSIAQAINRQAPDERVERLLVRWRNAAFFENTNYYARPDWPPKLADPFPEVGNALPEIDARQLSAEVLGGAIRHHGSLLVRGLVDTKVTDWLRAQIDESFSEREVNPHGQGEQARFVIFRPLGAEDMRLGREFLGATAMLSADAPHVLARWCDVLRDTGVFAAVAEYLGEDPVISATKGTLYRVPADVGTQWHQDGAFLGTEIRTVNLWVAVTDCGIDAPGLDVVPWRLDHIVEPGTDGAMFEWSVGQGAVDRLAAGRPTAHPHFKAGDAMLFDEKCLHRTGVAPGMTQSRYAVETWLFAPSKYDAGVPIVV